MNNNHRICKFAALFTCLVGATAAGYIDPPVAIITPNPDFYPLAWFGSNDGGLGGGNSYDPDNGSPYGYDRGITFHDWSFWPNPVTGSVYYSDTSLHATVYFKYASVGKKYVFMYVVDDDYPATASELQQCDVWIFDMQLSLANSLLGVGDTSQLSLGHAPGNLYAGYEDLTVNAGDVIRVLQGANPVISGQDKGQAWLLDSSAPGTLTVEGYAPGQVTLQLEYAVHAGGPYPGRPYNAKSVNVTVVGVYQIEVYTSQWNDVTDYTMTALKGTKYTFRAKPLPVGSAWPSQRPVWTLNGNAIGSPGDTSVEVTFDSAGTKTLAAKCGPNAPGKSVTVNVVEPTMYQFGASPKTSEYREASGVEKSMVSAGILSLPPPVGGLSSSLQVVSASFGGCFLRLKG